MYEYMRLSEEGMRVVLISEEEVIERRRWREMNRCSDQ